jgi:N utilization substance protein A
MTGRRPAPDTAHHGRAAGAAAKEEGRISPMAVVSANRLELLQIADAVAREKVIDRSIVIGAMEEAIAKAARSRYGAETDVHAEIDPRTGALRLSRHLLVVDQVENDAREIDLETARRHNPAAQVGDVIADTLPPFDFGRVAAQSAKQVIVQKVRDAERDRQYEEYKDRIGEVVNGLVKRVEYGNVIVDLGRGEGIVRRDEGIPRETFRPGDRIRSYLFDVRREVRGPQIFLSRSHPQFMAKLFAQEVPEIYDGIVEVKAVARDPGSRAKIAVISRDSSIDPVGACVGMRGSRVQAVVGELQGEKIDIIPWSQDQATFIVNALQPAEVVKVVLDEEADRIEVVVPDDQLSLAIGRRGQNVRLASQLTGWDIDILTEAEESERRQKEFVERTNAFMEALDVDETVGQLLAAEGFRSVEEIAYVEPADIANIQGLDEETGAEIQNRAQEYLARIEAENDARRRELGVEDELREIDGITTPMLVALGENEVRTIEDLAGCATDDLVGYTEGRGPEAVRHAGYLDGFDLSRAEAEAMIVAARVRAGWIEAPPEAPAEDEQALEEAEGQPT